MSSNPSSSSLSSVVSNLVRAQMGTTLAPTVTDEDLDRHVAELILKEAKKKAERYGQQGIRALISSNLESNAPRPNKRFLSSIIKSTDEHNKTVLRAQALAAEEVKRERLEQEKRERRRRAQEAVEAEKQRRSSGRSSRHYSSSTSFSHSRSGGSSSKRSKDESWDRWDGRTAERKRKARDWATWKGEDSDEESTSKRRKQRSHSRSQSRDRDDHSRSSRHTRDSDVARPRRDDRERSHSPHRKQAATTRDRSREDGRHRKRSHSASSSHTAGSESPKRRRTKYALDELSDEDSVTYSSSKGKGKDRNTYHERKRPSERHSSHRDTSKRRKESRSPAPVHSRSRSVSPVPTSRSTTPGPQPQPQLPSKMDKYFEETYDPRLDVAPLSMPTVPKEGLINDAEYDGWDHMLELIRLRQQDKEDKKALERLGLSSKEIKERKKSATVVTGSSAEAAARWGGEGANVMDIEYSKRGAVREWDLGKAGF